MYTVTNNGSVYLRMNELNNQYKIDIINDIMKAIEIVSKKPRHNS
jgi:competence protein ComFB